MPLPLAPLLLKKHWAAFHTLDRCRLLLSATQPNDKSCLPGELAALTPALYFATPGLSSCQDGDPGTSRRWRDCGWSWAHVDSGSCLGLAFQNVLLPDFWFLPFGSFPLPLQGSTTSLYRAPSHQSHKSDKLASSMTPGSLRLPTPCPGPLGRKWEEHSSCPSPAGPFSPRQRLLS